MYFATLQFWIFFALLWVVHSSLPLRHRPWLLLAASYYYYATWSSELLGVMVFSTFVAYGAGNFAGPGYPRKTRKIALGVGLTYNIAVLVLFRYLTPYISFLRVFAPPPISTLTDFGSNVIFPVGVSFFTLQCISYTVDRYRQTVEERPALRDFSLYVCFFPQLLAGPVERVNHLVPQFQWPRPMGKKDVREAFERITLGLFQKVIVADTLAHLVNAVFTDPQATSPQIYVATIAFAFQLYGDFAGYSNIAMGVARLLGYELSLNFDRPFLTTNPRDFWRRWHITVYFWLRDYVYRPLVGSAPSQARRQLGLFTIMLLMGIWHGSGWNFIVMGVFLGLTRVAYSWWTHWWGQPEADPAPWKVGLFRLVNFHLILPPMLAIRSDDLNHLFRLLGSLSHGWSNGAGISEMLVYALPVVAPLLVLELAQERMRDKYEAHWSLRTALVATGLAMVLMLKRGESMPFIYFVF